MLAFLAWMVISTSFVTGLLWIYSMLAYDTDRWTLRDHLWCAVFWIAAMTIINKLGWGYDGSARFWGWFIGTMVAYAIIYRLLPARRASKQAGHTPTST